VLEGISGISWSIFSPPIVSDTTNFSGNASKSLGKSHVVVDEAGTADLGQAAIKIDTHVPKNLGV